MFGESESESPRVPSPWDTLTSASASSSPRSLIPTSPVPRLVPEVEEGNIEYKLHLISPSPSRFARLVTQLKWRLLEGGGQAYYELGVADSGALVGLPRAELESSLETLEEMAGEIGASVVVVKEIEVPASMAGIARNEDGSARDGWDPSRDPKLRAFGHGLSTLRLEYAETEEESPSTSTSPEETETDLTEPDDCAAHPDVATIFTMDLDSANSSTNSLEIEIASVYKPRPMRRRPPASPTHDKRNRNRNHQAYGKKKWVRPNQNLAANTESSAAAGPNQPHRDASGDKADHAKTQRRRRRDTRRHSNALLTHIDTSADTATNTMSVTETTTAQVVDDVSLSAVVIGLESLHVTIDQTSISSVDTTLANLDTAASLSESPATTITTGIVAEATQADKGTIERSATVPVEDTKQARLIVEALVVRKLSLEEGFLDFGGFAVA